MIRPLTEGERALARQVFGEALRLDDIRLWFASWPVVLAFVPGRWFGRDWIVWPRRDAHPDLSLAPLWPRSVFVHELVHVWQAQTGVNLLTAKVHAGWRAAAYRYVADDACAWDGLNIEQQAMVVQHRYLLDQGRPAPGDPQFYDRVCPFPVRQSARTA